MWVSRWRIVTRAATAEDPDIDTDVLLRDGRVAQLRPIVPADSDEFIAFYGRVSDQSKYYRFFSPMPHLSDRDVNRFTHVDHVHRVGQIDDGVCDQLAGSMPGDAASSVDVDDWQAVGGAVGFLGALAGTVRRRVLE